MLDPVGGEEAVQPGGSHGVELGQGRGLGGLERQAERLRGRAHAHVEEVLVLGQSLPDAALLLGHKRQGGRGRVVPQARLALLGRGVADRAADLGEVGEVLAPVGDDLRRVLLALAQAAREDEAEGCHEEHAGADDAARTGR